MATEMYPIPVTETNALQTVSEDGILKAQIGEEQVVLLDMEPVIELTQPGTIQSKPYRKNYIGKFAYTLADGNERSDLEKYEEELKLFLVKEQTPFRMMFAEYKGPGGDNKLLCRSSNNEVPHPRIEAPYNDKCCDMTKSLTGDVYYKPVCPMAVWAKDENGKPKRPPCLEHKIVTFFDFDLKCQVKMIFKSTALKAWNDFKKKIQMERNKKMLQGKPLYNLYIKVTADNHGTHSVPVFEIAEAEEALALKYAPLINYYKEAFTMRTKTAEEGAREVADSLDTAFGPATQADRAGAVDLESMPEPTPEELAAMDAEAPVEEEEFTV